jgi:ATP-dependent Clp protease, protease subunit
MANRKQDHTREYEEFVPADERIYAGLLENHIHFLYGDITEENTMDAIYWITYENLQPGDYPLTLYVNSDGGSLQDAFALIDVMRKSKKPVHTIGIGSICSSAFMIFAAGERGHRLISPTATAMCHQYTDAMTGKYHDIKATSKEHELINKRMVDLLTEFTDHSSTTIKRKLLPPSDAYFTAEELIELGVADGIF